MNRATLTNGARDSFRIQNNDDDDGGDNDGGGAGALAAGVGDHDWLVVVKAAVMLARLYQHNCRRWRGAFFVPFRFLCSCLTFNSVLLAAGGTRVRICPSWNRSKKTN